MEWKLETSTELQSTSVCWIVLQQQATQHCQVANLLCHDFQALRARDHIDEENVFLATSGALLKVHFKQVESAWNAFLRERRETDLHCHGRKSWQSIVEKCRELGIRKATKARTEMKCLGSSFTPAFLRTCRNSRSHVRNCMQKQEERNPTYVCVILYIRTYIKYTHIIQHVVCIIQSIYEYIAIIEYCIFCSNGYAYHIYVLNRIDRRTLFVIFGARA